MTDDKNANYILPSTESESDRLELQASQLYGGLDFLDPFLRQKPQAILDVGCGSGYCSRQVAAANPNAEMVGLDFDESRIAFAKSHSTTNKLHYHQGDMAAMPFEDNRFDLVYCRFVLLHDPDPSTPLREMVRVTKPGGRVVAYDMVHEGIWFVPKRPAVEKVLRKTIEVLRERGAEPNQGLYLAAGMRRSGLTDISARVNPYYTFSKDELHDAYRENWIATVKSLSVQLGQALDAKWVEEALRELQETSADDFFVETTVLAWGSKPF